MKPHMKTMSKKMDSQNMKILSFNISRFIPKPYDSMLFESAMDRVMSITEVRKIHVSSDPHSIVVVYRNTGESEEEIMERLEKVIGDVR